MVEQLGVPSPLEDDLTSTPDVDRAAGRDDSGPLTPPGAGIALHSRALSTLAINGVILLVGLITSIFLAHKLGPRGRGEVAAALLWPNLLTYIGSAGLISATLYFGTQLRSRVNAVLGTALSLVPLQSIIAIPLGFLLLPRLLASEPTDVVQAARIFLLVIPPSLASLYCLSTLQGQMHTHLFNALRVVVPAGYLLGLVALGALGALTVGSVVVIQLGMTVVLMLAALSALRVKGVLPRIGVDRALIRPMLKYGFQAQLGDLSRIGNQQLDQVLMAAWLAPAQLGLYVAAVSSANLMQALSAGVGMVTMPAVANQRSNESRREVLRDCFHLYWILAIATTACLAALLPRAIPLVFGSRFGKSILPAEVLLVAALLLGAKDVLTVAAQALGRPWLASQAELVALGCTVPLLIVLLPTIGIMGGAIASLVAYLAGLLLLVVGLKRAGESSPADLFLVNRGDAARLAASLGRLLIAIRASARAS